MTELATMPAAVPCRQRGDPDDWFPADPRTPREETERKARELCRPCPVQLRCLEAALALEGTGPAYGIFGGLAPWERERINATRAGTQR